MIRAGITGGIGSGKTIVCSIFNKLGIPIYNADDAAKKLMQQNDSLKNKLISTFGNSIYKEGLLNKKWLSEIVFNDPMQLDKLNKIVHPAVIADFQEWESEQKNVSYTIREAAILFESGTAVGLDHVILVDAPTEIRIKRIQKRDMRSIDEINNIMNNQWSSEKKRALADSVIENDDQHLLIPQILFIHHKLLNASE